MELTIRPIMIIIVLVVFSVLIYNYNGYVKNTDRNNRQLECFTNPPFITRYSEERSLYKLLTSSITNDLQNELPQIIAKYAPVKPVVTVNTHDSLRRMRTNPEVFAIATDIIILRAQDGSLDNNRYSNIRKICNISQACPLLFFNPISNIKTLADLQGKKVFAGRPGDTSYIVIVDLLKAVNLRPMIDVIIVENLQYTSQSLVKGLNDRVIDAVFHFGSHPNSLMAQVTREANLNIIGLEGLPDVLLQSIYPFSQPYEFNINEYGVNLRYRIKTRLFNILLCCDVKQPADIVYNLIKSIIENFEYFKSNIKTPENLIAMLDFNQYNIINNNFLIEHHPGARNYLRDIGFFTDNPDERCGYFAGVGECRPELISDMRFPNRLML